MGRLIILRGNSGSGKTTIAKQLQEYYQPRFATDIDRGTMLVQQDVVRRDILRVKDTVANPAIKLIEYMVSFGGETGHDVILEGILNKSIYGDMLSRLISQFKEQVYVYYFDISFDETVHRHESKPNSHEFGKEQMREWYKEKDLLGLPGERIFSDDESEEEIFEAIVQDL